MRIALLFTRAAGAFGIQLNLLANKAMEAPDSIVLTSASYAGIPLARLKSNSFLLHGKNKVSSRGCIIYADISKNIDKFVCLTRSYL